MCVSVVVQLSLSFFPFVVSTLCPVYEVFVYSKVMKTFLVFLLKLDRFTFRLHARTVFAVRQGSRLSLGVGLTEIISIYLFVYYC